MVGQEIGPLLSQSGFVRKGNLFRRVGTEVIHVVGFQKSLKSQADSVLFAVNLGVASVRLLSRAGVLPSECAIEDCQWRTRLGKNPRDAEMWWTVTDAETAKIAADEVKNALRSHGLAALDALSDDSSLRDLWLSGISPGLTDVQRLLNLSILLRTLGPAAQADAVMAELRSLANTKRLPVVLEYLAEVAP